MTVSGPWPMSAGRLRATAKSAAARTKFIATPASRTPIRIQIGLRLNAPAMACSTSSSVRPFSRRRRTSTSPSSPSMRTNPPSGIQLRLYRVPCHMTDVIRGGKPIPNSSTVMPARLATRKWPSSWTSTSTTRTPRKAATVPMTSIRPIPRPCRARHVSADRTSASSAAIASRSGSSALPQRSTAPAIVSAMRGKAIAPVEEGRDRDLVSGVEDGPAVAACIGGLADDVVRRVGAIGQGRELEGPPLRGRCGPRGRGHALGVRQGVLDREAHVGKPELGLVRAVGELDERVDDALGMDHRIDLRVRQPIQPFGLDDLERLVDERRRVDGDLRPHAPGRVRQRLVGRHAGQGCRVAAAKRSPAGGEHQARHARHLLAGQALPDGRVLAVDRTKPVERVAAELLEQAATRCPPVMSVSLLASATRRPALSAARVAGRAAIPVVATTTRSTPSSVASSARPPSAHRSGASARASASGHHQRASGQAASCSATASAAWPAARARTVNRSPRAGDHLERLAADGSGRAEDRDAGHATRPAASSA